MRLVCKEEKTIQNETKQFVYKRTSSVCGHEPQYGLLTSSFDDLCPIDGKREQY